jgi:hypothetical protein
MKHLLPHLYWIILLLGSHYSVAQQATLTVNYQLTYDVTTGRYIAWVVPNYSTPNALNTSSTEKGGTAQFTIKVPASFSITNVQDINGSWEKTPIRLGPGNPPQTYTTPLDPAYNYFVIGKSPNEVDYGTFTTGVPVPLFSFTGNGCFGALSPLPPGDPFIAAADNDQNLNVANSFYSRSGTPPGGNQAPLEQFNALSGLPAQCAVLLAAGDTQTLTANIPASVSVLANDTYNGQPASSTNVTVTITTPPATGTATVNANGTIGFTPAAGFSGPVSFTYTICAPGQTTICSSAPVNLTVNAVIVASPDQNTTTSGTPLITTVLANDLRNGLPASITNVTVALASQPANGAAVLNVNGTITYTPTVGFSGVNSFSYTICDIAQPGICSTTTASITVISTVVANPDSQTLTAGIATTIPVLTNDLRNSQPASATNVTVTVTTPPATGTATVNANGTIGYAPASGFSGPVSFTYTICDISQPGICSTAPVNLTVNAVVVASPDQNTTASGSPVTTTILTNDLHNGLPASTTNVTVALASQPANGAAVLNLNGTVTYTPAVGFSGVNSFSYTICDIAQPGFCSTSTVSITVISTVEANPDSQTLTAGIATTIPVLTNDLRNSQSASFTNVTVTIATPPATGTATVNINGTIGYAPASGFSGPVSFTYTICDISQPGICSTAPVNLTVISVIIANTDQSTTASGTPITTTVLANDTRNGLPASSTNVTVSLISQPANGTAVLNANGTITYTPAVGFSGVNSFSYTICGIAQPGVCSTTPVSITVLPSRPVAVNDLNQTVKNIPVSGNLRTNDSEPAGLALTVTTTPITGPTNGTVVILSNGSYIYTPATNFVGTDSFVYQVCNTAAQCTTALATIKIRDNAPNANDAPIAQNDLAATTPNTAVVIAVKANDSDPDGQPLGLPIIVSSPINGNLTVNSDGTITYTPVNSFTGVDSFVYQVCDNGSPILCDQATVTITVRANPATNQTLAYDDAYSTFVNIQVSGNVSTNDQDLEGNTQTVNPTPVVGPSNGTLTLTSTGSFTYSPVNSFTGTDSFVYQVCDNGAGPACATATAYITVFPPNGAVDLSITISQPTLSLTATLGSTLPVSVNNVGTGNYAGPVSVTLTLPANVSVAPGFTTSNGFTCSVSGQLVTCVKSVSLATVTSETLAISIIPNAPTASQPLTFTANTAIPSGDGTPANNTTTLTTPPVAPAPLISLLPQVYLQGALFGVNSPNVLMRDDLRTKGYIPLVSPYAYLNPITATAAMNPSVTTVTGNDAIVDWIFVELRSATNGTTIMDSRAALLQRDGDIVDVDGVSPVIFSQALPGSYYVTVRHRNHLGVMSRTALPLSSTTTTVDFRNPNTPTFTYTGTASYTQTATNQAQVVVQQGVAMWAGNSFIDDAITTPHNSVIFQGTNNDINTIYQQIITNPLASPSFKLKGYTTGDVNMNGETIFQGTGNDVEFIYQNIINNHPGNSLKAPFFIIREQLP